jgi:hypothetical protein
MKAGSDESSTSKRGKLRTNQKTRKLREKLKVTSCKSISDKRD